MDSKYEVDSAKKSLYSTSSKFFKSPSNSGTAFYGSPITKRVKKIKSIQKTYPEKQKKFTVSIHTDVEKFSKTNKKQKTSRAVHQKSKSRDFSKDKMPDPVMPSTRLSLNLSDKKAQPEKRANIMPQNEAKPSIYFAVKKRKSINGKKPEESKKKVSDEIQEKILNHRKSEAQRREELKKKEETKKVSHTNQ